MRLLFLSLFVLIPAAAPAASPTPIRDTPVFNPNANQRANCPATSRYEAAKRGKTPQARKLNQLPAADAYKAVYRRVGGCVAPIVVQYGIGGR
jgi:hypothetical protein